MCGRFTQLFTPEDLVEAFELPLPPVSCATRYNITPGQPVPVVRCGSDGRNLLASLQWGLIPPWAADAGIGSHMINARCESVHEKPAFRHAIKYRRCVVPVSGFYEWQHGESGKKPHYITAAAGGILALAGVWESWQDRDREPRETFSILTTEAGRQLRPIHDRMPVLLAPGDVPLWLNRNMHDPEQLQQFYAPCPDGLLNAWPVADLVNDSRNNDPECISPL